MSQLWEDLGITGSDNETMPDSAPPEPDDDDTTLPEYEAIFGAPDFDFLKEKPRSPKARGYERRVQSLLKSFTFAALNRGDMPDAAALIKTGPKFARAVGDAAVTSKHVAQVVDMLTAPDSPMVPLAVTGIALVSQLLRNHQAEAELAAQEAKRTWKERREARKSGMADLPRATTTIRLPFGRKITLKWKIRLPLADQLWKRVTGGAVPPEVLVYSVFADDELLTALRKQGYDIKQRSA